MILALRVFLPFALAYLLAYVLRVVNAVAGEPIQSELAISAAELGLLTSGYFLAFALCQVPLGIALDRYGARRTEGYALLVAALGCVLFALAQSFSSLLLSRVMMGLGASMSLMAPFTAYRLWFGPERLPTVVGLHMAFGAAGSAVGGTPVEATIEAFGWRNLFLLLASCTVLASLTLLLVVPRRNDPRSATRLGAMLTELRAILTSSALWRMAPLSASVQVGALSILSLWTGPWLRQIAGFDAAGAALWLSVTSVGLMAGFLLFGAAASRAERYGKAQHVFVVGSALYALTIGFLILVPPDVAAPLWIAFAVFGSAGILSYAIVNASFPAAMAGRVNTALNCIVFLMAFLVQWLFGVVLEIFADADGAITRIGYQAGFAALLLLQLAAYLPLWLTKPSPRPVAA